MIENARLLEQAISALKLRDIWLHSCGFQRPTALDDPSPSQNVSASILTKRGVRFEQGELTESESQIQILRVYIDLGIRIAGTEGDEPPIYVEIEAVYCAEYSVLKDVSEEAIKAFAQFNAVHNVWPFWRHHVFDTVQRGRLPHIEVPLFSGPVTAESSDKVAEAI